VSAHRPRPGDWNPSNAPGYWYGAPTQAALHALRYWRRKHLPGLLATGDETVLDVDASVVAELASGGRLDAHHREVLTTASPRWSGGPTPPCGAKIGWITSTPWIC